MREREEMNSNLVEDAADAMPALTLADLPDPDGIFSSITGIDNMKRCVVDIPNIRDGNGTLIKPSDYDKMLPAGSVVMVNVYMKLFVQMNNLCELR